MFALMGANDDSVSVNSTDIVNIVDNSEEKLKEYFGAKTIVGEVATSHYLTLYSDSESHMKLSEALAKAYPDDTCSVLLLRDGRYIELHHIG